MSVKYYDILSAQTYLKLMTGKDILPFLSLCDDPVAEILNLLKQNGITQLVRSWPALELKAALNSDADIVLVNVSQTGSQYFVSDFRWFEIFDIERTKQ